MSPPIDDSQLENDLEPLREAFQSLSIEAPNPELCPSPEQIWDACRGSDRAQRDHQIIAHTAICPSCAEEWRLAREMQAPAAEHASENTSDAQPSDNVIRAPHRFRRVAAPLIGLAAAAMLALVIGLPQKESGPPVTYRAGQSQEIESLLAPGEALAREACILRWSEVEGALYNVLVSGADLQVLAQPRDLETTSYQVPATALDGLDGEIYWQVEAVLPNGSTQSSKTFVNKIE